MFIKSPGLYCNSRCPSVAGAMFVDNVVSGKVNNLLWTPSYNVRFSDKCLKPLESFKRYSFTYPPKCKRFRHRPNIKNFVFPPIGIITNKRKVVDKGT